ncbi:hypothetical protein V9T40_004602 [Parthenolecanium corni]|uniref:Uncharacterized protein n=1 Tax=Parthenolecanium corni TaxID=536013 RepID=A0AAN9TS95_9HEMI
MKKRKKKKTQAKTKKVAAAAAAAAAVRRREAAELHEDRRPRAENEAKDAERASERPAAESARRRGRRDVPRTRTSRLEPASSPSHFTFLIRSFVISLSRVRNRRDDRNIRKTKTRTRVESSANCESHSRLLYYTRSASRPVAIYLHIYSSTRASAIMNSLSGAVAAVVVVAILAFAQLAQAAVIKGGIVIPTYSEPCRRNDANFNGCIKTTLQKLIPQFKDVSSQVSASVYPTSKLHTYNEYIDWGWESQQKEGSAKASAVTVAVAAPKGERKEPPSTTRKKRSRHRERGGDAYRRSDTARYDWRKQPRRTALLRSGCARVACVACNSPRPPPLAAPAPAVAVRGKATRRVISGAQPTADLVASLSTARTEPEVKVWLRKASASATTTATSKSRLRIKAAVAAARPPCSFGTNSASLACAAAPRRPEACRKRKQSAHAVDKDRPPGQHAAPPPVAARATASGYTVYVYTYTLE